MIDPASLANLAPQVAIVVAFLFFLYKLGIKLSESMATFSALLQGLDSYIRLRNGSLEKQMVKSDRHQKDMLKMMTSLSDKITDMENQHITTQVVDTAIVTNEIPDRRKEARK